jgi:hypothetical protein
MEHQSLGAAVEPFGDLPWLTNVVLRSISGYYDGPLSGLAEYDGRLWWYAVRDFAFDEEGTPDEFVLYELSEAEVEAELEKQAQFREHVGTHWELDESGHRKPGVVRDQSSWSAFYDRYPPKDQPTYKDHHPIGRFRAWRR